MGDRTPQPGRRAPAESQPVKPAEKGRGDAASAAPDRLQLAAIGIEAELVVLVDGEPVRPEDVFGDPTDFLRGPLMHRTGTSYQVSNGGVIYFDTGVIEVATPVIEISEGCAARAGRSLWETLHQVRDGLDAWERRHGRSVRLEGFSTHYNVSFELPVEERGSARTVEKLARLLAHILPVPVMLLATNRRSTGVGVRPRGDRIEITVDFTPSAALMVATCTLVTGIVRGVMQWSSYDLEQLDRPGIPVIAGYRPMPHTSRKGWLARHDCYPRSPFATDPDAPVWVTTDGDTTSLRRIGGRITRTFWRAIRRISDPFAFQLIGSVMRGDAPSLLDLDERPPEYEDVGRLCDWNDLFSPEELSRSRYERVLIHAIAGRRLRLGRRVYTPVAMRGWSRVEFRGEGGFRNRVFGIDELLDHLDEWEEAE